MPNEPDGQGLLGYLGHVAGMAARGNAHPTWRYQSIPQLVLDLAGLPRAAGTALPDGIRAGTPKDCFYNAHTLAMSHLDLVYVEGFAQAAVRPVPHAWCVNLATGAIVDPTWATLSSADQGVYLGVAFTHEFIARHSLETRTPSVLEADWTRGHRALEFGFVLNPAGQVAAWGNP